MSAIFRHKGNFEPTTKFLTRSSKMNTQVILNRYGREGVSALSAATPQDTGLTSESWGYEIKITNKGYTLTWTNSNVVDGIPIVILIQYGHGTGNGGYVESRDFINPVMKPIFDKIARNLWEEVSKS